MTDSDSLKTLHTGLVDACNGYEEAIQDAEQSNMKALFERAKRTHEKAHDEIHRLLVGRGANPDDSGSFMTTVHKTVISLRSAVTGLNNNSLSAFAGGEERLIGEYDKAIEDNVDDLQIAGLLERQKAEIEELIDDMKSVSPL